MLIKIDFLVTRLKVNICLGGCGLSLRQYVLSAEVIIINLGGMMFMSAGLINLSLTVDLR